MDSERTTRRTSQRLAKAPPPEKRCQEGEETKLSAMQGVVRAMAEEHCRKRLREETTCSVCLDYFTEPVILDCGHNFCRTCILYSCALSTADAACPQCKVRVQVSTLWPNWQLASLVEIAKELSKPWSPEAGGHDVCEQHQEPLKLFCQDDGAPICVGCDRSKEHQAHSVVPMEEAAQECKDQISRTLETLRKERENILQFQAENEKETQDLLKQMKEEGEKTATAFSQLRQFLEEQENLLLAQKEEVEQEIDRRREEHQATLSAELRSLNVLIQELEEKQQQSGNELLQNIGDILGRCKKESFENPVAFPVDLKWRIHDFCDKIPFLEALMKQFQDSLASGLKLQEAKVTLDPNTAHSKLILSEDGKSVRWGQNLKAVPSNPERFEIACFVLGREGFTSGRYFWDVAVGPEESWGVGVARKSVKRKGKLDCVPAQGIFDVGKWKGKYRVSRGILCPTPTQDVQRIRVTLNCVGGRVAFFDADTGEKLYVYSGVSFSGETILPLFWVFKEGHLTLCP